jgi:replication factor A1
MSQLSSGICRRLNEAPQEEIEHLASGHTVQLLSVKKVSQTTTSGVSTDRYRIIISDGIHFVQAMLATQLNDLVTAGEINKNSVVVIDRLACNFVQEKR